jgi:nicotinate-nucleotide adenylyltransferase
MVLPRETENPPDVRKCGTRRPNLTMNIGLFGGTFDPIHSGHIALARAARERFDLGRIYFVPAHTPPHKSHAPLASFSQRYAMVVLATQGEKTFVPSLLESPDAVAAQMSGKGKQVVVANYSIDTVRRLKQTLKKADRLFFLIGIDAFKDIAKWREAEALLRECEFIVASRPGYSLADVANSLPEKIRPKAAVTKPFAKQQAVGDLVLAGATIRLLDGVEEMASSTAIRNAVAGKKSIARFLCPAVAEYVKKMGLYS